MRIDRVLVAFIPVTPYLVQQFHPGIDPAGMFYEMEQQVKLFGCQRNRLAIMCYCPFSRINGKSTRCYDLP